MTYFFADGAFGFFKKYQVFATTVHHLVTVTALLYVVWSGKDASALVILLGIGEITNPLLTLMEFIKLFKWGPPLSVIIQLSFVFSFVIIRGPFGYWIFAPLYTSEADFALKCFVAGIWIISMNYIWITLNLAIKVTHQVFLT